MKRTVTAWRLDPNYVGWGSMGSSTGRRKQATKSSRVASITGATVVLHHFPTGLEVEGEIPSGRYTRVRMRELKQELYRELFPQLEELVGKYLGVRRRS